MMYRTAAISTTVHPDAVRPRPGPRHAAPPHRPRRSRRPHRLVHRRTPHRRDHRRGRRRQDRRRPRRLAALDPTRHTIIYLPNPTVGVRGIHHQHRRRPRAGSPLTHHATLAPQAADALAAEHAERGRTPVVVIDEAHLLDHAPARSDPHADQPRHGLRPARSPACSSANPPCGGG